MISLACPSFAQSEALVSDRHLASDNFYETGEEAIQATAMGFSRTPEDFVEIHWFGANHFQVRAGRDASGEDREQTVEGSEFDELMRIIQIYYAGLAPFREYWSTRPDRKDFLR